MMKKKLSLATIYWIIVTAGIVYVFSLCDDDFHIYDFTRNLDPIFIFAASFVLLAMAGLLKDFLRGIPAAFVKRDSSSTKCYKAWKTFYKAITVMAILSLIINCFITSYNLRWVGIALVFKNAEQPLNDLILNEISGVLLNGLSSLFLAFIVIVYTLPISINLKDDI